MSIQKCPLCKKKYNDIDSLANHIERKHLNEIPEGWNEFASDYSLEKIHNEKKTIENEWRREFVKA